MIVVNRMAKAAFVVQSVLAIAALLITTVAQAATIAQRPLGNGVTLITIDGTFQLGDEKQFVGLSLVADEAIVAFNSDGGNLFAALEIGKAIRLKGFATAVGHRSICASACGLAWLGGTRRFISPTGSVGFHAAYTENGGQTRETGMGNALVGA